MPRTPHKAMPTKTSEWQNQRRLDDSQTGKLYDFNSRFFTPVAARFISPDSIVPNPADPQSLNRYTAMANNPLKFTDPTGHSEACDDGPCHSGGDGGFIGPVLPPSPIWTQPSPYWWIRPTPPSPPKPKIVNKPKIVIFVCGLNISCGVGGQRTEYDSIRSKVSALGANLINVDIENKGRDSYVKIADKVEALIAEAARDGYHVYLVGHSAGANAIVFMINRLIIRGDEAIRAGISAVVLLEPDLKTGNQVNTADGERNLDSQEHGQRVIRELGVDNVLVIRTKNSLDDFPSGCGGSGVPTACQIQTFPSVDHRELTHDEAVANEISAFIQGR